MENLLFTVDTVSPVFFIIFLGSILRRLHLFSDDFISASSQLVFKVALPALVFSQISRTDFFSVFNGGELLLLIVGTMLTYTVSVVLALVIEKEPFSRGAFVQGAFRGNIAIVGFAVILNVFGESGLSRAAILLSVLLPLFNVLSVVALTIFLHQNGRSALRTIIRNIVKNPLIISVLFALPFSLFHWRLPVPIGASLDYLSRMTLPLALLSIGASLNAKSLQEKFVLSVVASIIKIVIYPVLLVLGAAYIGFRGESLGVLFVIAAVPTAVSSFVMAKAMDNDSHLAANIVMLTTLGSIFTIGGGIWVMKSFGLI